MSGHSQLSSFELEIIVSQSSDRNRRIVLASRPVGAPTEENFRLETSALPVPSPGELLLRTVYLSLDPYMRGRISDAPSYAKPVEVGEVMVGGTVSRVVQSNAEGFSPGDWVLSASGWQDYAVAPARQVRRLDPADGEPQLALGVLGMPGFTAYMGLLDIGQPKAGETVVVAAATGPVGATVGQIARIKGCRVVGIAGGAEKTAYAREVLGFDDAIDHRAPDFAQRLKAACPDGIDVYFENVGGAVFDAVFPLLNTKARVPVCGLISQYNATGAQQEADRLAPFMRGVLTKRLRIQGFIIFDDYGASYGDFAHQMGLWVRSGEVKHREDIVQGLDQAVTAFQGLLQGKNFGKLIVQVAKD